MKTPSLTASYLVSFRGRASGYVLGSRVALVYAASSLVTFIAPDGTRFNRAAFAV